MTRTSRSATPVSEDSLARLAASPLFIAYRDGFTAATGLDLWIATDPANGARTTSGCSTSFCTQLNRDTDACRLCRESHRRLTDLADRSGVAQTAPCFAGFRETAIPVRIADTTVAWLRTGGVQTEPPQAKAFDPIRRRLEEQGLDKAAIDRLKAAWLGSASVDRDRYRGTVTLLAAFALQVADLLNRILLEESQAQPEAVTVARRYIDSHLDEKITLDEVASHVGISPFHFCKVFKDGTGMTLTEYVNRRRVELAKQRLVHPDARVTEIAFDIGFQSLSQFNRSFARYVGMSPTQYRQRSAEDVGLLVA